MCDYWRTSNPSPITQERAETLVEELRQLGVGTLRFLGGEPLLRRDLFAVLEHAAPLGFERIILATNGLLLDRFAGEVNRSCITNLTVSIDGLADTNDAIRGVPGYFDRVLRNLTLIQDKRIKLATLLTNQSASDIHGLIQICKSRNYLLDVNLPLFDLPYASSRAAREGIHALWPTEKDVERVLQALVEAGYLTALLADGCREYLLHRRYPMRHCVHGFISDFHLLQRRSHARMLPEGTARECPRTACIRNPRSVRRQRRGQIDVRPRMPALHLRWLHPRPPTRRPTSAATPSAGWTRAPRRRDCPDGFRPADPRSPGSHRLRPRSAGAHPLRERSA